MVSVVSTTRSARVLAASFALGSILACRGPSTEAVQVQGTEQPLYVFTDTVWQGPIPVCFTEPGFTKERQWLRSAVENSWQRESGAKFTGWGDCTSDTTGISVRFTKNDPNDVGSWSHYGSTSSGFRPSMQLKLFDDVSNISEVHQKLGVQGVGLHEFGHALGFVHEHERPDTPESCVSRLPHEDPAFVTVGAWDPYSVVNYCRTGGAFLISPTDAAGARQFYGPAPSPQPPSPLKRTIVLIQGQTQPGQDMFIRGGIDHGASLRLRGIPCTHADGKPNLNCAIPIHHAQYLNATTKVWKNQDQVLDWYGPEEWQSANEAGVWPQGTPLDWTTNNWPSSWGASRSVAVDGFGLTPLNTFGAHYWMLDVLMDCSHALTTADGTAWFELKSFISNGPGWEPDVNQQGRPYASNNHFAKCGMLNVFRRGDSSAQFVPL